MTLKLDTPFDQYTRQTIVADLINDLRENDTTKFKILDVGGYKGGTKASLPNDLVTVVDIVDMEEKDYVKASALNLPFDDKSYDFVVSFDALEHVQAKERKAFVSECLRVSNRGVIICAPHNSPRNALAEKNLNLLYKKIKNVPHRWLMEHIDNGLPEFSGLIQLAGKKGYHTVSAYSNDTDLWTLIQSGLLTNEEFPDAAPKLIALNKKYNRTFNRDILLDGSNAYRQILFAFRSKKDAAAATKYIHQSEAASVLDRDRVVFEMVDYYVSLAEAIRNNQIDENRQLKSQIEHLERRIEDITSSRSWKYASKLSRAKAAIVKRRS